MICALQDIIERKKIKRLFGIPESGTIGSGEKGDKGDKGDRGDAGYTPIKGVDYFDGATGSEGPRGLQGLPGEQGPQGEVGQRGFIGETGLTGETGLQGIQGQQGIPGNNALSLYTINVQALTSTPVDSQTVYFGMLPKAPTTTANISKVYIPRSGTIKRVEIYCYAGTAGTNETWSLYIRKNNTTDTLIKTLGVNTNERRFYNDVLNISVVAGDYIEIKGVQPLWATNPATCIYGGYIYIE